MGLPQILQLLHLRSMHDTWKDQRWNGFVSDFPKLKWVYPNHHIFFLEKKILHLWLFQTWERVSEREKELTVKGKMKARRLMINLGRVEVKSSPLNQSHPSLSLSLSLSVALLKEANDGRKERQVQLSFGTIIDSHLGSSISSMPACQYWIELKVEAKTHKSIFSKKKPKRPISPYSQRP